MDVIIYYCDRIGEISDILFEKIFRLMPEERQVRVGRIQNHIRQLQSVGVYALFLYGCREEEKNCWRRWAENGDIPTFSYSKYGKPEERSVSVQLYAFGQYGCLWIFQSADWN